MRHSYSVRVVSRAKISGPRSKNVFFQRPIEMGVGVVGFGDLTNRLLVAQGFEYDLEFELR